MRTILNILYLLLIVLHDKIMFYILLSFLLLQEKTSVSQFDTYNIQLHSIHLAVVPTFLLNLHLCSTFDKKTCTCKYKLKCIILVMDSSFKTWITIMSIYKRKFQFCSMTFFRKFWFSLQMAYMLHNLIKFNNLFWCNRGILKRDMSHGF